MIKTNREILNNTAFQKQTDEYKFTGDKTNKFTLSLCESKNPYINLVNTTTYLLGKFL